VGKRDARVDAFIEKSAGFARPILRHMRELVHATCPNVEETLKWRMPAYMYKGIICMTAAFKKHCAIVFWHASVRKGFSDGKSQGRMGGLGKITALSELPNDSLLRRAIKQSMKLNESGKNKKRPVARKRPLKIPPYFKAFLQKHKKALAFFEAFSPSHQREYVTWIAQAKQEETRQKRLNQMVNMLSQGRSRNWKYEK
jgi:uncharacterized protein YdeI (YjbR/CyaY-like superfamily)